MIRLPIELRREPLVDAVFEVRMGGGPHLADLLPGALFGQLSPRPRIERLPAAEIPSPIRSSNPSLAYVPTTRLDWREFTISFGDRNVIIGCKLPYPKWPSFRSAILDVVNRIAQVGIEGNIERYSMKYVNLIQADTTKDQLEKIVYSAKIGDVEAYEDHVSIQIHRVEKDTTHIVSVVTSAQGKLSDGRLVNGVIVDIDSIRSTSFSDFKTFAENLEPLIDSLRLENKIKFFSCLKVTTIEEMEPRYE